MYSENAVDIIDVNSMEWIQTIPLKKVIWHWDHVTDELLTENGNSIVPLLDLLMCTWWFEGLAKSENNHQNPHGLIFLLVQELFCDI